MTHIALVTLSDDELAARLTEEAAHGSEQDGRVVWLTALALEQLAALDEYADGHYDGAHVWIDGTDWRVNPSDNPSTADLVALAEREAENQS